MMKHRVLLSKEQHSTPKMEDAISVIQGFDLLSAIFTLRPSQGIYQENEHLYFFKTQRYLAFLSLKNRDSRV